MTSPDHPTSEGSSADPLDQAGSSDDTLAPGALPAEQLRRRTWMFAWMSLGLVTAAAVAAGFLFKVDYVALRPGGVRETEPLVMIEGTEAYPSEGEIFYTTVSLRQNPSFFEYLWLRMDDDVDLVEEQLINGDRTPDETRELNLGLMTESKDLAVAVALEHLGYEAVEEVGVIVLGVVEGEAADGVITPGDVIEAVDGIEVLSAPALVEVVGGYLPGDSVTFRVQHGDGSVEDVTVTLGENPNRPGVAFLGVSPDTLLNLADDPVGFDVAIDSGNVGGPSAGLAFTLAILDELTPGELAGGLDVAITGEIRPDGSVGSVGGSRQKAAAVRDSGADVFIIPLALGEDRVAQVIETAGPDVQVFPVATLDEAIAVLEGLGGDVSGLAEYAASDS